ncbi:universal stress protein [Myroides odoratimimus]|uniref:universal stress protein n=1 Tax=Myroides odoratimimus TaxID=76832 RepID=UPI002575E48C|nr:universal stress protein [Myroides odoratimimus]MDM1527893.1 universal stress protein [Myroides odoratimimus]
MKKILFPTDYSETANNAFKYALQLANYREAELYVLHVYDPPIISGGISPHLVENVIKKNDFEKLEQLHANSPALIDMRAELNLEHVPVFFKVKEGLLIPEILNAIEENHIDFLVMGTDGANASFHKKLLGSNTINTITKVDIPVLSVPKEAHFRDLNNIIFTSRFEEEEEATLDDIIQGVKTNKAQLKIVHVKSKGCISCEEVYNKWKEKYKDAPVSFHIFNAENIEKTLLDFIEHEPVDLVATIKRNKTFIENILSKSVTQHLAKRLKVPFFVYKSKK